MTCIVVAIKAGGIWENELPTVYGKKAFVEEVFKAIKGCLMVTRSGARERWCVQNQNPVHARVDGNIVDGSTTTK